MTRAAPIPRVQQHDAAPDTPLAKRNFNKPFDIEALRGALSDDATDTAELVETRSENFKPEQDLQARGKFPYLGGLDGVPNLLPSGNYMGQLAKVQAGGGSSKAPHYNYPLQSQMLQNPAVRNDAAQSRLVNNIAHEAGHLPRGNGIFEGPWGINHIPDGMNGFRTLYSRLDAQPQYAQQAFAGYLAHRRVIQAPVRQSAPAQHFQRIPIPTESTQQARAYMHQLENQKQFTRAKLARPTSSVESGTHGSPQVYRGRGGNGRSRKPGSGDSENANLADEATSAPPEPKMKAARGSRTAQAKPETLTAKREPNDAAKAKPKPKQRKRKANEQSINSVPVFKNPPAAKPGTSGAASPTMPTQVVESPLSLELHLGLPGSTPQTAHRTSTPSAPWLKSWEGAFASPASKKPREG